MCPVKCAEINRLRILVISTIPLVRRAPRVALTLHQHGIVRDELWFGLWSRGDKPNLGFSIFDQNNSNNQRKYNKNDQEKHLVSVFLIWEFISFYHCV